MCQVFRIGNTEYFPGTKYKIEFNTVDNHLRIYDVLGCKIVSPKFITRILSKIIWYFKKKEVYL